MNLQDVEEVALAVVSQCQLFGSDRPQLNNPWIRFNVILLNRVLVHFRDCDCCKEAVLRKAESLLN